MSETPRDTQFAGFAARLLQELLDQGAYVAISEWATGGDSFKSEQLIARRAYDLVQHTIETADYSGVKGWIKGENIPLFHKVVRSVSDLTTWPEEEK